MSKLKLIPLCVLASLTLGACQDRDEPREPVRPVATTPEPAAPTPPAPVVGSDAPGQDGPRPVRIRMNPLADSGISGMLTALPTGNGVRFEGRLARSEFDAEHAIHVHEIGDCSAPDGSSAGEHFNPGASQHGHPDQPPHHAGDLPNLKADHDGQLIVDIYTPGLQIGTGSETDILGRALVLHAQADDYTSQPAGASGARIACGVIRDDSAG